jgi:hypothetical protein
MIATRLSGLVRLAGKSFARVAPRLAPWAPSVMVAKNKLPP